jgi:hypothetical protein
MFPTLRDIQKKGYLSTRVQVRSAKALRSPAVFPRPILMISRCGKEASIYTFYLPALETHHIAQAFLQLRSSRTTKTKHLDFHIACSAIEYANHLTAITQFHWPNLEPVVSPGWTSAPRSLFWAGMVTSPLLMRRSMCSLLTYCSSWLWSSVCKRVLQERCTV